MLLLAATLYGFSEAQHRSTSKNEAVQEADYDITIGETGVDGSGLRIMTKDLFFTAFIILIFTGHPDIYECVRRIVDLQKCCHTTC